ncbi:hypothetical protein K450DRAFT_210478 [Umbelopsis ramanniana AG]|uniref:Autophagy-related protein 2 n=1 Tax=Umbelopsis ramanniana AG TaxID=1314678 RepID=A0AAD5HEP1_UMBRA|nr:uncharacterized protein K450DRAFT_210478 [Umbelopsis ramanniana AG]KAI8579183.1 hypothetical protein K450DRAFT_210478 [Umbelopsis ramanniana AG]
MKAWQALSSGWTAFAIPSNIQKRLYKFLLRKSIGRFLAQELDFENFDVELVNGCIELRDLDLNLEVLDEILADTPFTITEGHIGGITASLPWSNFWSGDIVLEMRGLRLTFKPEAKRPRKDKQHTDEEPMLSTSMHLAGDFLKTEVPPNEDEELRQSIHLSSAESPNMDFVNQQDANLEGLQVITKVIDKMLAKIKIKVIDSVLRLHHTSNIALNAQNNSNINSNTIANEIHDYFLDIQIPSISYFDETPGLSDGNSREPSPPDVSMQASSILLPPAVNESIKILVVTSPTIWIRSSLEASMQSFATASNPDLGTLMKESSLVSDQSDSEMNDSSMFHSALGDSHLSGSITPQQSSRLSPNIPVDLNYEALIFSTVDKENWLRFKFASGPPAEWSSAIQDQSRLSMKQLDVLVSSICIALSPKQVVWMTEVLEMLTSTNNSPESEAAQEHDTMARSPSDEDTENLEELMNSSMHDFDTPESPPIYQGQSPLHHGQEKRFETNIRTHSRFDNIPLDARRRQERHAGSISSSPRNTNPMTEFNYGNTSNIMSFSNLHHQKQAAPVKIKFSLNSANLYLLMNETSVPPGFFSAPSPESLDTDHLKISLNHFILRFKDWSSLSAVNLSGNRSRTSRTPGSPMPEDKIEEVMPPKNALDIRISDISIHEWLASRSNNQQQLPGMSRLRYDMYNPVLRFNENIPKTYRSDQGFSTISLAELPQTDVKKDTLRFKIESWEGRTDSPARQEIAMETKPLQLNVDIRMVDRLEQFAFAFINRPKKFDEDIPSVTQGRASQRRIPRQTSEDDIYADLKQLPNSKSVIRNHSIKLPFIRIILLTPDMTNAKSRGETTQLIHEDFLIIDIRKLCSRNTGLENNTNYEQSAFPPQTEPLEDIDYLHIGSPGAFDTPQLAEKLRIQFEIESANIFLKKANDMEPTCWFMVKPPLELPTTTAIGKAPSKRLTTVNIAISSPQPEKAKNDNRFHAFDPSADQNIPYSIFENLKRDQNVEDEEEKIHIPREEQSELSARFKKFSIESSIISVQCNLPLTRMNLAKDTWDRVQIIQNDLILWQPRFLAATKNDQQDANVTERQNLPRSSGNTTTEYQDDFQNRTSSFDQPENGTQSFPGPPPNNSNPTLLSIMACLQRAEWTLHYQKEDADGAKKISTYDAIMSNFQYFAAIRNLGQDENITTLDIDEILLFEVKSENEVELLLERTIPKSLQYTAPMIALMTKLQSNVAENVQDKTTNVVISNLKFNYNSDVSFIDNLVKFQNGPSTMNIIDPPDTFIKVYVTVSDTSIVYRPSDNPLVAAVVLDELKVVTEVFPNQERLSVNCQTRALDLYICDDRGELSEMDAVTRLKGHSVSASRWWRNVGMARCLAMRDMKVNVSVAMREEEQLSLDLALTNHVLGIEVCKDSLPTIMNLISVVTASSKQDQPSEDQPFEDQPSEESDEDIAPNETTLNVNTPNMLASLDEQAFVLQDTPVSESTNTVSNDMEYVEEYYTAVKSPTDNRRGASPSKDFEEMFIVPPRKPRRQNATPIHEDIIHIMDENDAPTTFVLDEKHFSNNQPNAPKKPRVDISNSIKRIRLKDFTVVCKLYDGYDWRHTRQYFAQHPSGPSKSYSSGPSVPQAQPHSPTFEEPERHGSPVQSPSHFKDDFSPLYDPSRLSHQRASSEAGYIGEDFSDTTSQYTQFRYNSNVRDGKRPAMHHQRSASSPDSLHPRGSSRRGSRRTKNTRSQSARIEIRLEQINVEFDLLPSTGQLASHLYISVRDFEILDHIKTSMYRKFLSYMRSDMHPRERGSNMIRFELTSVRPVPSESAEEHRLKFRILPMRLYVDQDAVIFLINFFSFDAKFLKSTPMVQPEVRSSSKRKQRTQNTTFFQHVEIYPVIMKVDYRPKHVNYGSLKEGQFAEIVNFFHLDAAEMNLSHVRLTGIKGYDRLAEAVLNHWLPHIRDTQLGNVVTGVSSIQSVVNIGSGVADLVLLPIEQYRKDGRIIRGLQRGTQSFARATTMEAIKIGSRLAAGTQVILEQADDFFSPIMPNDADTHDDDDFDTRPDERRPNDSDSDTQEVISKFADQPSDLSQGLQHAYHSLSKNIKSAAHTVLAVPTEIQESEGPHGTAKAVIRAVPVAVIRPLIGFSEAFANVLVGIRNTIDPGQKLQSVEKYKRG